MNTPLISAVELASLADRATDFVLLDARTNEVEYRKGHLRGAQLASLERDLSAASDPGFDPTRGGRHPLPPLERWLRRLGEWGVAPETDVVIYDDQSGANAAARAWWMLRAVGHDRVAVLDGGWQAAVAAGLEVTAEESRVSPRPPYPAAEWRLPVVDLTRVDQLRSDPAWRIVDVRSAERFRGETEPIDPIAGHIPGAINLPYFDNLAEGSFKTAAALRTQYLDLLDGVALSRTIVHCGSGVTACHTLLALEAAGLRGASLYVGSWGEWCRNDLPRIPFS